jgi:competence protein ComEC
VVALAAVTAGGALVARPVPVLLAAAAIAVAWWGRWRVLLVLATGALACGLGAQAVEGARPVAAHPVDGVATLVSDPVERPGSVQADVRIDGSRFELQASGSAAGVLRPRLAGEQLHVRAIARPRPDDAPWLLRRHVVGRIAVSSADSLRTAGPGDPASVAANRFRRLLSSGAASLDPTQQALFTGFVVGDDRAASAETRFDFRASGLSHLLAVSGANVAFVLAVAGPLLRRLGLWTRLGTTLALLAFFALLTRFEPSVLRATAMAVIAAGSATFGWPVSAVRLLALAVTALVLVDPLLAGSLAFQLSVAASAGIILLAPRLAERLPGPRPLADGIAVAVAAQVAVAPLLIPAFGGVPVAAVPANLLAAPAAGPVMVWGLTAGTVAGIAGGPVAMLAHLPTRLLIAWVERVARVGASVPLGDLGAAHLLAGALIGGLVLGVERGWIRSSRRVARRSGAVALAVVVVHAALLRPVPPPGTTALGAGAELTVAATGATVLTIDGRVRTDLVLTGLRASAVRSLDVVVVRTSSRAAATAAQVLQRRLDIGVVLAPDDSVVPGAVAAELGATISVPGLVLVVRAAGERVDVSIETDAGVASARGVRSSRNRVPDNPAARGPPVRHHPPRGRDGDPEPHAGLVLRQGQLLGLRRLPAQGRGTRRRRRRLPRRRRGEGRAR